MAFDQLVETIGLIVDVGGVAVIAGGILWITVSTIPRLRDESPDDLYQSFRRSVGKVILLGLELLVAGDIIRTVAIGPTIEGVVVLGLIVLVRTFLSFSLEVELYGQWPWRRNREAPGRSEREHVRPTGEGDQ
jgi:uncharacterized membrane protein